MDVSRDGLGVRVALSDERVRGIVRRVLRAERVREAMISVAFVSARKIAQLNREHLRHSGPTDVITFSLGTAPVIGDIYICPDVVRANAFELGVGVREETARVVVHGTLHALGHDHPDGDQRTKSAMWRKQEKILGSVL